MRLLERSEDDDAIRSLRAWLKNGLRSPGLRCLEVREIPEINPETQTQIQTETQGDIKMARTDLNKAKRQDEREVAPPGIYPLRVTVKPGNADKDSWLTPAKKNPVRLMLALRCTILGGEYHGIPVLDYHEGERARRLALLGEGRNETAAGAA
jgi:hypothetical protein